MRILVISDIHANDEALKTVFSAAGEVDEVWCLGDVVGYGPSPNECVALLQEQDRLVCLMGNHDAAAISTLLLDSFNPEARSSIEWLQENLSEESQTFLSNNRERHQFDNYTLVHASPRQPILEYVLDKYVASQNFEYFNSSFCLIGHTHIPAIFNQSPAQQQVTLTIPEPNQLINLQKRAIINPGSVGQPRDEDPRAAFAILDDENDEWEYRRAEYDVAKVQEKMKAIGLPKWHILRLENGW